ncbi:hypothetical protein CK510_10810 [Brunnivagina elsteri CCALA 953]|uniref:Uncharacterized protein n=1 Tax=Brunnivagina elsteri CCALA 953 TaxID=987040 RepID=A0A2A2TJY4_9CYAN|nr:hypothetical protein CK510_10810 [Calothrix elsteri CCALA 953]
MLLKKQIINKVKIKIGKLIEITIKFIIAMTAVTPVEYHALMYYRLLGSCSTHKYLNFPVPG